MTEGYEALRAQATGAGTAPTTVRGLALFLRSGLAAWMTAWRRLVDAPSSPPAARPATAEQRPTAFRLGPELAVVLTEMALSQQRRWVR